MTRTSKLDRRVKEITAQSIEASLTEIGDAMARQFGEDEVGWLIEMIHNDAPIPRWWHPKEGWVWEATKALRFARQIDAEDFAKCMYGAGGKATEHVFVGGSRP